MSRRLAVVILLVLLLTVAAASIAYAAVVPHRHYLFDGQGEKAYIGPNFCDYSETDKGFELFHTRVHITNPSINAVGVHGEGCGD